MARDRTETRPWRRYIGASLPGWIVGAIVAVWLYRTTALPAWVALTVLGLWIASGIAMFPRVRRYYTSEPAAARMRGEEGVAVSRLDPRGRARVHGELWQARTADPAAPIAEGSRVRVREVDGLELIVELARAASAPERG